MSHSTAAATHPRFDIDQQNKTIATAIGDLPLSPIMDPSYWEMTTRYQVPKQKQGKAQNSVERQFRNSPYGECSLALARLFLTKSCEAPEVPTL